MKRSITILTMLSALAFFTGCAGTSGGSGGGTEGTYRMDLDKGTQNDIRDAARSILLERYQYQFRREDYSPEDIYIETSWRNRSLFDDEVALGAEEARTRIYVRARPASRGSAMTTLYRVDFEAESEVLVPGSEDWKPIVTPLARRYLREIGDRIKIELNTGLRGE